METYWPWRIPPQKSFLAIPNQESRESGIRLAHLIQADKCTKFLVTGMPVGSNYNDEIEVQKTTMSQQIVI